MEARAALGVDDVAVRHRTIVHGEVGHRLDGFGRREPRGPLCQLDVLGLGEIGALALDMPNEPMGIDLVDLNPLLRRIGARSVERTVRRERVGALLLDTNVHSDLTFAIPIVRIVAQYADGKVEAERVSNGL